MTGIKGLVGLIFLTTGLFAQQTDSRLDSLKQRLDSVIRYEARVQMDVDVSFVNMPVKFANIIYEKGEPLRISSDDFVMIPKRGLDLTLNELYRYPFMTLKLGKVAHKGRECDLFKIIPTTEKSDYSIATLWLDSKALQILKSQISTKKNGVFDVTYSYNTPKDLLPDEIQVAFEVSGIKIPLRFLGKDTRVDKEKMKAEPEQRGTIYLKLTDYSLSRL